MYPTLICALSGCVTSYDFAQVQASRELLRGDNEVLSEQVNELQGRVNTLEADLEAKRREAQALRATYEALVADLQIELESGKVEIEELRDGVRVHLAEEILFAPGETELGPAGIALLERVALQLRAAAHRIHVQGHTDDVSIGPGLAARFPTNWELAGARAARVVRLFEASGVDPGRLSAVSLGSSRPVASNAEASGRARNRRIEIRLTPALE